MSKSVSNQWIAALQRCEEQQEPFAIVTVIEVESPSSATVGDKAVVTSDGMIHGWIGGGCTQPVIQKAVADAMGSGDQMTVRIQPSTGETRTVDRVRDVHMACHSGGSIHLLVEPFKPTESVAVIGETPVAELLSTVGPQLGIPVDSYASGDELAKTYEYCIVATQGRKDKQSIANALARTTSKVWFIASQRKADKILAQLTKDELDPSDLKRLVSPAGLHIGAETSEEIVISLLGQLVSTKRRVDMGRARVSKVEVA
jgi:xanthine dehydrogenase accessory factor